MNKKTFILNDETKVNQRGFRILNNGLDLERFKANPVILNSHNNSVESVIGRWENIRIEKNLLLAEPVFDESNEQGLKISQQVNNGFIKGCSLGIDPLSRDNFLVEPSGDLVLVKGEIYEASIVAVPSNANALVKLYAQSNKMKEKDADEFFKPFHLNDKKVLQLQSEVNLLTESRDLYKSKYEELQAKESKALEDLKNDALDKAIKEGKINATSRNKYKCMLDLDYDMTISILAEMKPKQSLSALLEAPSKDPNELDKSKWGLEEYRKYAPFELRDNPDLYKKLVQESLNK